MEPQVVEKTGADGVVQRDTVTTEVIAQNRRLPKKQSKSQGQMGEDFSIAPLTARLKAVPSPKQTFS